MKNMTTQAVEDRVSFVRLMRALQPPLAMDEEDDLKTDFLVLVVRELPNSELAAKARLILRLEEAVPPVLVV